MYNEAYDSTEQKVRNYCNKILEKICFKLIKTNEMDEIIEEFKKTFETDFLKNGINCRYKTIMRINDKENKDFVELPSDVTILVCRNIYKEKNFQMSYIIKEKGHLLNKCMLNIWTDEKGFYIQLSVKPRPVAVSRCIIL